MKSRLARRILEVLSPVQQHASERYAIAVAAALLAVILRWMLDPLLGHVAFYTTVYMGVAYSAVVCGFVPAVLSAILGFAGIFYWFVDPRHSLLLIRPAEVHAVIGFFLVCAVLIALGEATRRKQLQLNAAIDALTAEARERERAERSLLSAHNELEQRVEERTQQLSQILNRLKMEVRVREEAEAQSRRLSVRLMTLQDEERRRIARELHDSAGQKLAAMKMTIGLLPQAGGGGPAFQDLVHELNTIADEAVREIRTTSYLLHPPLLDEAGIGSAARWFVEGFAKRSGIGVQCDIQDNLARASADCELALFRTLQESLTNVHRHSEASSVLVRLKRNVDELILEVSDNGRGIDQERLQKLHCSDGATGVGILGMQERIRELGGKVEIQSGKTGTRVSVSLPIMKATAVLTKPLKTA